MTVVKFRYTGQDKDEIPRNITHLKIDSSVREIPDCSFSSCRSLVHVEFHEGLLVIGKSAFAHCRSLEFVNLPSSLEEIHEDAQF